MSYLYDVCKRIAFRRIPPPGAEVCNCYIVGYMKKLLFLSFFGLFLLACTTDEGDGAPFVTDVVMPPSSQLFAPGDEVTVAARGFEADDDIMLRIAWPLSQAALPEGYADGVWAVVTERTESDITFLAPGGYPASTTEGLRHGVRLGAGLGRSRPLLRNRTGPIACPGFRTDKNGMQARIFSGLVSSCTNFAYFYTPKPNRLCR